MIPPGDYMYKPQEDFIFIDIHGLDEGITSSTQTPRRSGFRSNILNRDRRCVVTEEQAVDSDAAHLVLNGNGDEYILKVFDNRSARYDSPSQISGIDDIQNGVLVAKNLHSGLSRGVIAFIKTPNFGLQPDDLVRVDRGPSNCTDRITLQQLEAPDDFNPDRLQNYINMRSFANFLFPMGANLDISFQGTGTPPPSHVILDFTYGIAAFKHWGVGAGHEILDGAHKSQYKPLLATPNRYRGDDDDDADDGNRDDNDNHDDPCDPDHYPGASQYYSSIRRDAEKEMMITMDKLNAFLMLASGISPEEAARRREKQMEEEEEIEQQASCRKVLDWRRTVED